MAGSPCWSRKGDDQAAGRLNRFEYSLSGSCSTTLRFNSSTAAAPCRRSCGLWRGGAEPGSTRRTQADTAVRPINHHRPGGNANRTIPLRSQLINLIWRKSRRHRKSRCAGCRFLKRANHRTSTRRACQN